MSNRPQLPAGLPEPTWSDDTYGIALYRADCMDVLEQISGGAIGAIVTDPPYGINYKPTFPNHQKFDAMAGDNGLLDLRPILNWPCPVISWGANCYPEQLPCRGRWICWDKRHPSGVSDNALGSPFELAWENNKTPGPHKMIRIMHGAYLNDDGHGIKRVHPTQKPIRLMEFCIGIPPGTTLPILDPFMGSGTTGVAAVRQGRAFVGIELDSGYFAAAVTRIRQAIIDAQNGELFATHTPHTQLDMIPNPTTPNKKGDGEV